MAKTGNFRMLLRNLRKQKEAKPEMLDWNTLTLDQMADHLRKEFQFDSSGTARCVFALLEFYDKNKP